MDAIFAALITAGAGAIGGYLLGTRKARYERLYDEQAEVISELFKKLYKVQQAFAIWVYQPHPSTTADPDQERQERQQRADELLDDLRDYFYAHSIWLDSKTAERVEDSLVKYFELGVSHKFAYKNRLYKRGSSMGLDEANRLISVIGSLRQQLEQDFRAILHPAPWWRFWR